MTEVTEVVSSTDPVPLMPYICRTASLLDLKRTENGVPGETRTHDPQIRNLMLYPAELRGHGRTISSARTKFKRDNAVQRALKWLFLVDVMRDQITLKNGGHGLFPSWGGTDRSAGSIMD